MKFLLFILLFLNFNNSFANINLNYIKDKKIDKNITAVATYTLTATILSKKEYNFDYQSKFSNYDIVFGWNKLMYPENYLDLKIKQNNRWYFWKIDSFDKLSRKEIETSSSNHHIIIKDKNIEKVIKNLDRHDVVLVSGYLVNVHNNEDNFVWKTSLTNLDVGDGACEIFYITSIKKY